MTLFQAVKENITTRQAAERYGIKVGRNGMCCCPFHDDGKPSMKVDRRYYCFACNCTGDVIDFTGKLFHMEPVDAAMKLAEDFGVQYEYRKRSSGSTKAWDVNDPIDPATTIPKKTDEQVFMERRIKATRVYLRYRSDLIAQKEKHAPKREGDDFPKDFVQALSMLTMVNCFLDILLYGDEKDQKDLLKEKEEEVGDLAKKYGLS